MSALPSAPALILPPALAAEIIAHARAGWPAEVCGLVRGCAGRAIALHPASNIAADPSRDYEVAPSDLLVQFDWEEEGDELVAIYHSHPASPAYPSASDAWNAHYPDAVYLICSLADWENPVIAGFFLRPLAGEVDFTAVCADLPCDETRPGRWGAYLPAGALAPPSLAHLDRPAGLALYIVHQQSRTRVVGVEGRGVVGW